MLKAVHEVEDLDAPGWGGGCACEQAGSLAMLKRGNSAHVEIIIVLLYVNCT